MKKSNIVIIVIVAILIAVAVLLIGGYNGLVSKSETVDTALANLDVMLQRRADLIPNLVNTVKGYTDHENSAIEKVTEARSKLVNANTIQEKSQADSELSDSIDALMLVVENYPDLKASQNFIQLSDELAGTENRISTARKDYNDAVQGYNLSVKKFPNNLISGMFGFEQKDYFETTEENREVPKVEF